MRGGDGGDESGVVVVVTGDRVLMLLVITVLYNVTGDPTLPTNSLIPTA